MVHVTEWGSTGPRVVLVHGGPQGSRAGGDQHFSRQKALADQGWHLAVPDRPGHGRSPAPGRPDDAEADSVWVADLLDDGAHLVGHSFGGCVALAAAARRPEAVKSLVLIEPAMQNLATGDWAVRRFILKVINIILFSFSAQRRAKRFSKLLAVPDDIMGRETKEELTAMGKAISKLKLPNAVQLQSWFSVLREAGIPVLVVTGGWGDFVEVAADAAAKQGNGDRLIIASPHHFPHLISDEFNEALAAFMRNHETPG